MFRMGARVVLRLRREEGLLAAFCPGGEEEGLTALAGSELAVRLGL